MKIYRFSRFLALPFIIILAFFAYNILNDVEYEYFAWALVPITFLVLIYLFQPQIDYWWLDKNPVEIDEKVLKMLKETNPRYQNYSEKDRKEFDKRLVLYLEGKEFLAKGMEQDFEVPYDVRNLLAQIPVTMTMNKKDFLLKDFDRIIVYKHAFPSPRFKFLHTVETHVEDGIIIFALDHAEAAFFSPDQYYNVAWHAYAEAYIKTFPNQDYPEIVDSDWVKVESTLGYDKTSILKTLGFETMDLMPVLITCYFLKPERFNKLAPSIAKSFDKIFNTV